MKSKPRFIHFALLFGFSLIQAHALDFNWDVTPGTIGVGDSAITGGAGTWNTTNGNWTATGVTNVAWANSTANTAIFGGTGGAVTLGSAITANNLTFNSGGYSIAGAFGLSLGGTTSTITVTNGSDTATINSNLTLAGGLNIAGAGIVSLSGTNTLGFGTGTKYNRINSGTLQLTGGATSAGQISIGFGGAGTSGAMSVSGGTHTTSSYFVVGEIRPGTYTQTGGSMTTAAALVVGNQANSEGSSMTLTGGTFTSNATATVIGQITGGSFTVNGGTFTSTAGDLLTSNGGNTNTNNVTSTITLSSGAINLGGKSVLSTNGGTGTGATTFDLSGGNFTASLFYNGVKGSSTLNISGAAVSLDTLSLGKVGGNAIGTRTVNLNGGTLTSTNGIAYALGVHTVNLDGGILHAGSSSFAWANHASVTATIGNSGVTFDSQDFSATTAQILGGAGALTKTGSGTWILSGANTYGGITSVNAGTLLVTNTTGSGTGTGTVTVAANGTLGGTGSVSGAVTAAGSVAPGATGTGTLTTGALTLSGTYQCQLDGTNCDLLAAGNLTLTGATLAVSTIGAPTAASYVIATYSGTPPAFTTVTGMPTGYALDMTSPNQIKLVHTPFGTWAAGKGLTGANNGWTQDADGDGVNNLIEFGFASDPRSSASGPITNTGDLVTGHGPPTTRITNGVDFRAVFGRRKDYAAAGLTYTVQFSANMTEWVTSTDTPTVVASDAEIDAVTVPYPLLIETANGEEKPAFFRVGISTAP